MYVWVFFLRVTLACLVFIAIPCILHVTIFIYKKVIAVRKWLGKMLSHFQLQVPRAQERISIFSIITSKYF